MTVEVGQSTVVTDTGRKRRHNEDSFVHRPPLFAVADGMGGAQAGEVASQLAAAALKEETGDGNGAERFKTEREIGSAYKMETMTWTEFQVVGWRCGGS